MLRIVLPRTLLRQDNKRLPLFQKEGVFDMRCMSCDGEAGAVSTFIRSATAKPELCLVTAKPEQCDAVGGVR